MPTPTTPVSSVTDLLFDGVSYSKTRLTEADAGRAFVVVGGNPKAYVARHLYGPGRNKAETARTETYTLPDPLPAGKYTFDLRRSPDKVGARFSFSVYPAAVQQNPTPAPDEGQPLPPSPIPVPAPPASGVKLKGTMALGLSDLAHAAYAVTRKLIAPLGLSSFRVWFGSQSFGAYTRDSEVANALTYEAAGLSAIYCVAQDGMTPELAKNAPKWILRMIEDLVTAYDANEATVGRTIQLQYLNEPDLTQTDAKGRKYKKYWEGTLDQYVSSLAEVYKAIKASKWADRVKLIAAGFSWDTASMVRLGGALCSACDAIAYHGYPRAIDTANMARYGVVIGLAKKYGKPIKFTEASPGFGSDVKAGKKTVEGDWAPAWPRYLATIEAMAALAGVKAEAIIFNARNIGTTNSAGAMFTNDWKPTVCYNTVKESVAPPKA